MDAHAGWFTFGVPCSPTIGVFAGELLLLRVDADHGLSVLDEARDRFVEVAAIVDRMTFRAHIIETGTESFRLRATRKAKS
jgi:hypothetical protein